MLQYLLSTIDDAVIAVNSETGKVLFVSPVIEKITGYLTDRFLDSLDFLREIIIKDEDNSFLLKEIYLRHKEEEEFTKRIYNAANEKRWIKFKLVKLTDSSEGPILIIVLRDITEFVVYKQQAQEKEWFLSSLIDGVCAAIFRINSNGQYKYVNHFFETSDGADKRDILGRSIFDFVFDEDKDWLAQRFRTALENPGELQRFKLKKRTSIGAVRWYNSTVIGVKGPDGSTVEIQGIAVDITDHELAQSKLLETKADIEALINNTSDLIWSIDDQKNYKYLNKAFRTWMKQAYHFDPVEGSRANDHGGFSADVKHDWEQYYDRALTGDHFYARHEEPSMEKVGPAHFEVSFDPILNSAGKVVGVGCFARNITDYLIDQSNLKKQYHKLETIASLSSHELRRPVASLLGLWDILDKEDLSNPENVQIIEMIGTTAAQLDGVIRQIVDHTFVRIDS